MYFISPKERELLISVSQLAYCNPFLPEWVEYERSILGRDFVAGEPVQSLSVHRPDVPRENVRRIAARVERLAGELRSRLSHGVTAGEHELVLYEDAVVYLLYQRFYQRTYDASFGTGRAAGGARWRFYQDFLADWSHFFAIGSVSFPTGHEPRHTFACFRQIVRAFEQIFQAIIGSSLPAARMRASVWQSIFTHDMRRYRRTLYERMSEFATLITGPSGTGKELAARAIAQSRYVPFDDRLLAFGDDEALSFFPINV